MSGKAFRLDPDAARVLVARLIKVAGKNHDARQLLGIAVEVNPTKHPMENADVTIEHAALIQKPAGQDMTLENMLDAQLRVLELPPYQRNYQFLGEQLRKYELDWAWPQFKFGLEVDGMAHRTKGRFKADYDKHVLALLHGWTILRVNGSHVRSGHVAAWLTTLLERYGQTTRG